MSGIWVSRGLTAIAQLLRRRLLVKFLAVVGIALPAAVSAEGLLDFNVGAAGNTAPRGMWGNSEVLWVTDYFDSKLYAYAMADGSRLASRDIETRVGDTRDGARYPTDVWSDGQIAWVTDDVFDRIYAYRLSDGGRVPERDLSLSAANSHATGLWGDGETLWVTDKGDGRVYAYALADGSRVPDSDFELAAPGGGTLAWAWGLWSDGDMFRVVDFKDERVYAYRGGGRAPEGDIENLRWSNTRPTGLWSDGRVLWVSDYGTAKLYAYNLPSQAPATPLTASWEDVPSTHDGETVLRFKLQFSEPVSLSNQALRTTVFDVTGGAVHRARRVTPGVHLSWWIQILPASESDVVVILPETTDCAAAGAICTADGKPLSNRLEAVIAGPSLPEVSITTATSALTEGTPATFEVTLDEAASGSLTVAVSVAEDGSALSGLPPASVTFNPGDTSATLSVPTEGDSVVESDSTVTATVTAGTGYTVGSPAAATATVEDDDSATFTVSAEPQTIDEGQTATLTVAISNTVTFAQDQTISLDLSASTATSGSDFTVSPQSLTLSAGSNSVTASITAVDDTDEEGEETVGVSASHAGTAIGTATVAITANDAAPLTAQFLEVPETHDGTAVFRFRLQFSEPVSLSNRALRTTVFDVTGGAVHGARRVTPGVDLSWWIRILPASESDVVVILPETTDCAAAGAICTADGKPLSNRLEAVIAGPSLPEVSITTATSPLTEGTPATFEVTLDEAASDSLTVAVSVTEDGSALSGLPPASVTFNTGDTSATLSVPTEGDFVVEADSTVTATVTAGTGYTVGSAASATATVEDDDLATFTVSAEPQTIDEGQTATLTVAISNSVTFAQDQTISLDLSASTATSGSDFTVTPQSLTLSAGSNSASASITAVDDTDDEGEETVAVSASHVGTAIGAAIVAITANDAAPLTAEFVGVPETHDGTAAFSFELHFSEEIDASSATLLDAVIDVTGGSVTSVQRIAQGSTLGWMIRVGPASDGDMVLVLPVTTDCAAAGAICTAGGKSLSNRLQATVKGSPTVSISGGNTVVEGTPVGFTLVRTGTTDVALTVTVAVAETGSMLSGTPPTTAIFAAGADTAPLSVATGDDTVSEPSSTVTARVVAGSGYEVASSSSADATVTDDDVAEFAVSAHPGSVDEGGNSTVTVAISNGVTYVAAQTIMLTMAGTAASDDYTLSPPTLTLLAEASSAIATFTAADDAVAEPEETVVVTATLDGVEIGSAALAINASAATSSGTPPVAAAGWDLTLAVDDVAYLDGSGSTGDVAMTWGWSFDSWPGGVMPHLSAPSAATPSFVPAETGTYVVRLTVSDGGGTASDTVMVTAVMTTEAASLMQADLWADANRDGRLDAADDAGEDTWSVSSGAIFVPNLDDDDGDEVRDGLDSVVNGIADLEDMTALLVRQIRGLNRNHQVKIEMVGVPEMDWPRVFLKRGEHEFEILIGDGVHRAELAAADLVASDAELFLDSPYGRALYFDQDAQIYTEFDGNVKLRVSVYDGNTVVSEDEIALRGSPILFSHHMQASERVFVVDSPDNETLVDALRSHLPTHVDLIEISKAEHSSDRWVQDVMQTGYAQHPTTSGVETGRTHVLLRAPSPLADFLREEYLGPGAGYGEPPGWYFPSLLNLGGNLELIPPHTYNGRSFPYGRIVIGEGMMQRPIQFYEAQGLQTPAIEVDVSWLGVGHVDELFQVVPDHNATRQERGWVVAIASPDLAIDLLEEAQDGGWGGAVVFAGREEETTIDEILADSPLLEYNDEAQAAVDTVRQALIAEVGVTDDDFREVPAMWFLDRRWAESYFPSIQNLLVVDDVLFLADPEGPDVSGADLWQQAARDAFDGLGYDIHFVDVYESYHLLVGSIHCGTNVEHAGETSPWWLVEQPGGDE